MFGTEYTAESRLRQLEAQSSPAFGTDSEKLLRVILRLESKVDGLVRQADERARQLEVDRFNGK